MKTFKENTNKKNSIETLKKTDKLSKKEENRITKKNYDARPVSQKPVVYTVARGKANLVH